MRSNVKAFAVQPITLNNSTLTTKRLGDFVSINIIRGLKSSQILDLLDGFTSEQVIMVGQGCNEVIMTAQDMGYVIDPSCFDENKLWSVS